MTGSLRKRLFESCFEIREALFGHSVVKGSATPIWILLLAALLLRVLWWSAFDLTISNEGTEYARLAQNLFSGAGYVDIMGGLNVNFPPLYPVLVGVFALFAGSEEVAGRLVSLISGVALVACVYFLASRVYDYRTAVVAGAVAACHPLLVAISVQVYSEPLFMALVFSGACFAIDSRKESSMVPAVLAGAMFGLAYLTRPEGIAYAIVFSALIGISAIGSDRRIWPILRQATIILAIAGITAMPYVVYLSTIAGEFRWEGKSALSNPVNARLAEGLSYGEAYRGLKEVPGPVGQVQALAVDESDQPQLLRQPGRNLTSLLEMLVSVESAWQWGKLFITSSQIGAPIIVLLALFGIVRMPWWRERKWEGLGLLAMLGLQVLAVMSLRYVWDRYLWPTIPLLAIYSAAGITYLSSLLVQRLPQAEGHLKHCTIVGIVNCAVIASILLIALRGTIRDWDIRRDRLAKEAGHWIREDFGKTSSLGKRPTIMTVYGGVTYYAGGTLRFVPYADPPRVLQYIHQAPPDYIVLRGREVRSDPTFTTWLAAGPGDPCLVLARETWSVRGETLKVWRWQCSQ